jgi:translocation and assembly module TamB
VKGSYVNPVDNKTRSVDFIVSMKLANQLSQLTIVFDVNSPDQYITSVLNTLSPDEVMRQAVNLLLFESIELPGIESSSTYMGSQLSSFVESQLNSMTKSNLKSVDLSLGVDTYKTSSSSAEKTSFTYEMERKLWKDRASVKLSGRLNDDTHAEQTNAVIENFTFEYAIDTVGTKFLKLYRHQDYEDILTGEVIKSGVGFIYRKSYPNLHDIWKRKDKKKSKSVKQSPDNTK